MKHNNPFDFKRSKLGCLFNSKTFGYRYWVIYLNKNIFSCVKKNNACVNSPMKKCLYCKIHLS